VTIDRRSHDVDDRCRRVATLAGVVRRGHDLTGRIVRRTASHAIHDPNLYRR
jgi:hypothetical protein